MKFLGALIFLNHWRIFHKIFGIVRQKQSTESWYPYHPKNYKTRINLKHRRVRPRCFLCNLGKKTPTEKLHTPLLNHKLFPYYNFSERQKRSPTKFFGTVRLKVLHGKSWNSPIIHEIFGCPNFFESLEDSPQIFRHCEEKTIDRIVIPYYPKAFRYHKISETQGSPYEIFRYCDTKRVDRIVIPILSKKFGNQKNSEKQTCSPTVIFGDVRQNKSTELWYSYYLKSFDTRTFLKHRSVRPRCFSAFWDKKLRRQNVTTPFLSINSFRTRTFLKDKSVPPTKLLGTMRLKLSTENRWTPLLCIVFLGALIFWINGGFSTSFLVLWDKNNRQNHDTPIIRKFRNKNNSETQTGSPAMVFSDVRQKNWQNCDSPIM